MFYCVKSLNISEKVSVPRFVHSTSTAGPAASRMALDTPSGAEYQNKINTFKQED